MVKNNKMSMKQFRDASDVLMRFLEEYQTVNPQNSDAIVEYEGKLELIAAPLNTKKFATLDSYSLVDLLKGKTEYAESKSPSFGVLFAEWRENQDSPSQAPGGVS
jgi:hypothetical protein